MSVTAVPLPVGKKITLTDDVKLAFPFVLTGPIILDGNGYQIESQFGPAIIAGPGQFSEQTHIVPNILDSTKIAYRTLNDARICLPADHWDVGNGTLTIEAVVQQTTPLTGQSVGLFGFMEDGKPAPVCCRVVGGKFSVMCRDASGTVHAFNFPWPSDSVVAVVMQFDGTNLSVWLNGVQSKTAFPTLLWRGRSSPHFGIGACADRASGWDEVIGGPHDFTYYGLKLTGMPLFNDDLTRIDGIKGGPNPFRNETPPIPFCRLECDPTTPLGLVQCYSGEHSYGVFIRAASVNTSDLMVRDLSIDCKSTKAPGISVGGVFDLTLDHIRVTGGSAGVGAACVFPTYPATYADCTFSSIRSMLLYLQIATIRDTTFDRPTATNAFLGRGCKADMKNLLVSGPPAGTAEVFRMRMLGGAGGVYDLGNVLCNYEGGLPQSYIRMEPHYSPATSLYVADMGCGRAPARIQLDPGSQSVPGVGLYKVERSFSPGIADPNDPQAKWRPIPVVIDDRSGGQWTKMT